MPSDVGELLGKYVRACWVLKVRLMSARRHLWASQTSLIQIENALLQMRKACETVGYLCLVAAELDASRIPTKDDRISALGRVLRGFPQVNAICLRGHGCCPKRNVRQGPFGRCRSGKLKLLISSVSSAFTTAVDSSCTMRCFIETLNA